MAHRIGRKFASETYPETRAGENGPPGDLLARNYAIGPGSEVGVPITTTGTEVTWGTVDVPGFAPQDVPITPQVTGIVMVRAVLTIDNTDTVAHRLQVQVETQAGVNPPTVLPLPFDENVTVPAESSELDGFTAIPFLLKIAGLTIGSLVNIRILLTSVENDVLVLAVNSSTIEVQEVLASTG